MDTLYMADQATCDVTHIMTLPSESMHEIFMLCYLRRNSKACLATPMILAPTPAPQPTQAPAPQPLTVVFSSASAVDYSYGSVSIHTLPGAIVSIDVTYCTGYEATSRSLQGTEQADGNGDYSWSWTPETKCRGAATAVVTASLNGQTASNADSFNVQ